MKQDKMISVRKERLKYAREYYDLTVDEVSQAINIKSTLINNFENGKGFPTYNQLSKLSNYYDRPLLFFFFHSKPINENISVAFRSVEQQVGMKPNKHLRSLIEMANLYRVNLNELLNKNKTQQFKKLLLEDGIKNEFDLLHWLRKKVDLPIDKQKNDFNRADQLIEYLREKMYDIGIYIFKDSFKMDNVSALCLYDETYPVILLNNKTTFNRQLFSIFHELFHLFREKPNVFLEQKGEEKECDTFASLFLIPDDDLDKKNTMFTNWEDEELIKKLADEYIVSKEAMAYRLLSKKYISRDFYFSIREESIRNRNVESSGGNFYYTRISYLGKLYLKEVFSQYYNGKIDAISVAKYTNLRAAHIAKLSSFLYGGEF